MFSMVENFVNLRWLYYYFFYSGSGLWLVDDFDNLSF